MPSLGADVQKFVNAKRPPAVICPVCGRQYGTASISIHVKSCQKKFEEEEKAKPASQRRKLPSLDTNAYSEQALRGMHAGELERLNDHVAKQWNEAVLQKCGICGRTFLPDRLAVHQRSCTASTPARGVNSSVRRGAPGGGATTYGAQLAAQVDGAEEEEAPQRQVGSSSRRDSGSEYNMASPSRPSTSVTGRSTSVTGRPPSSSASSVGGMGAAGSLGSPSQKAGAGKAVQAAVPQMARPPTSSSSRPGAAPAAAARNVYTPTPAGMPSMDHHHQVQGGRGQGEGALSATARIRRAATTNRVRVMANMEGLLQRVDSLQASVSSELGELRAQIEAILQGAEEDEDEDEEGAGEGQDYAHGDGKWQDHM